MYKEQLVEKLNDKNKKIRLGSLRKLKDMIDIGDIEKPAKGTDVNNHIHTSFSFSPYSPTKAIWMAYTNGLETAGIVDHDSIGGAKEFIEAGEIIEIATTIGFECRVSFKGTPLEGLRINHPDQKSIVYMCIHGVPHTMIDRVQDFLQPYRDLRNIRNRKMVNNINKTLGINAIRIDFERDVIPLSENSNGGSITERHILFALSKKIISIYGKGNKTIDFLRNELKLSIKGKIEEFLENSKNTFYEYDLLSLLKSSLVERIYIDADKECPTVKKVLEFSNGIGAIPAYAYLGDVKGSVTGDKKDQKFEDDFIDILFKTIKELGFKAVTYMPARNTPKQLDRVRALCDEFNLFQISGEDINSPRQSFICMAQRDPKFKNLYDATWALIGHEIAGTEDINKTIFSKEIIEKIPDLSQRIEYFKNYKTQKTKF